MIKNKKMSNLKILNILYIGNLILIALSIILPILHLSGIEGIYDLCMSHIGLIIRGILTIMVIIMWIFCIYIWSKFDKNIMRLILIIFLNSIYLIFYYKVIIKNKWI